MDSGAEVPGETSNVAFDPLTPLIPEEVCWIMDRVFACEVNAERSGMLTRNLVHRSVLSASIM